MPWLCRENRSHLILNSPLEQGNCNKTVFPGPEKWLPKKAKSAVYICHWLHNIAIFFVSGNNLNFPLETFGVDTGQSLHGAHLPGFKQVVVKHSSGIVTFWCVVPRQGCLWVRGDRSEVLVLVSGLLRRCNHSVGAGAGGKLRDSNSTCFRVQMIKQTREQFLIFPGRGNRVCMVSMGFSRDRTRFQHQSSCDCSEISELVILYIPKLYLVPFAVYGPVKATNSKPEKPLPTVLWLTHLLIVLLVPSNLFTCWDVHTENRREPSMD